MTIKLRNFQQIARARLIRSPRTQTENTEMIKIYQIDMKITF